MRVLSVESLRRRLEGLPVTTPRIVASGDHAVPWHLLRCADEALDRYRLLMLNAPVGIPVRPGVTLETPFVGPGMRSQPTLAYYPCRLSLVPALLGRRLPPDIVMLHTTQPRDGLVSLGVEVNILPAALEVARARGGLVVAQLNRHMPFTVGDGLIAVEEIDLAVEADGCLPELTVRPPSDVQHRIGERVADLVPDGATLQLGIGAIPDATLASLTSRRELRIWTEMVSDGLATLSRAGALADAPVTTSFAAGSSELYQWLDGNDRVIFHRTERTNDPAVIARQPAMTSINAALEVDLFAEANASYVKGRIYSGFGGQPDFLVGALHAPRGRAVIALPSWHQPSGASTIVPRLQGPATSFQHSFVVTEQGTAAIWGQPQSHQSRELVEHAAHPDARDRLRAEVATLL